MRKHAHGSAATAESPAAGAAQAVQAAEVADEQPAAGSRPAVPPTDTSTECGPAAHTCSSSCSHDPCVLVPRTCHTCLASSAGSPAPCYDLDEEQLENSSVS